MNSNISVAIIIVTYNRLDLLKECIRKALNQSWKNVKLLIINNASNDGTREYLSSIENEKIVVRNMPCNVGGAGGFSEGLKQAYYDLGCDYYLMIDDDAFLDEMYLEEIMSNLSPIYEAYAGTVKVNNIIDTSHRLTIKNRQIGIDKYKDDSFPCGIATFCGLLVSRKIVGLVGFPLKEMFIWNDDTEYCLRISQYSGILNINKAVIDHKTYRNIGAKKPKKMSWKEYYGFRNMIWIQKKYRFFRPMFYRIVKLEIKAIILLILSVIMFKDKEIYRYNSFLRFDAIRDGIRGNLGRNNKYLP